MATKNRNKSGGGAGAGSLDDFLRDMLPSSEVARILDLTQERVQQFCREGRLEGAVLFNGRWIAPRTSVMRFKDVDRPAGRPPNDN